MEASNYKRMGNVKILHMEKQSILEEILLRFLNGEKTRIFFINAHCFNVAQKNLKYRDQVNEAEVVLNDGIGVELGAKFFDIELKDNLNGTDFTPEVLEMANTLEKSLYILGGKPGIAKKAGENIQKRFPNIRIAGTSDGYFKDSEKMISEINRSKPDLLLVGMGVPLQEDWISKHIEQLDVTIAMAVGAFLDFTSGTVKRAPLAVRKFRLEWMYRLLLEPKRMFKRYLIGNITFFYHIFRLAK